MAKFIATIIKTSIYTVPIEAGNAEEAMILADTVALPDMPESSHEEVDSIGLEPEGME